MFLVERHQRLPKPTNLHTCLCASNGPHGLQTVPTACARSFSTALSCCASAKGESAKWLWISGSALDKCRDPRAQLRGLQQILPPNAQRKPHLHSSSSCTACHTAGRPPFLDGEVKTSTEWMSTFHLRHPPRSSLIATLQFAETLAL